MIRPTQTKFYADSEGRYLGGFAGTQRLVGRYEDGAEVVLHEGSFPAIPEGAQEVPFPPPHVFCLWNGAAWEPFKEWNGVDWIDVQ